MEEREREGTKSRKVDMGVFTWVITILSGVMLSISGYLFSEIAQLRTDLAEAAGENKALIRELGAKLEAERDKNTSILINITEIRGNIQNIKDKLESSIITRK